MVVAFDSGVPVGVIRAVEMIGMEQLARSWNFGFFELNSLG